ncbi:MAG: hypothetical protein E3J35_06280 [Methanomassiliicoccales archaeon]|nr:MAG: hypothetical protein E3J35_06280 [Methanomassiliicoccales archaeon]
MLFENALLERRFQFIDKHSNSCFGKSWKKTEHNLDFIVERDGIPYGCEVKNTLDYIPRDELATKLEICDFLGLRPLFIMRGSPKSYNYEIIGRGGYVWIFLKQYYPLGYESLVKEMTEVLELPVKICRVIEEGDVDRFENWHKRQVKS